MNNYKDYIPIHTWNKKYKGKERGKTPIDDNWQSKVYNTTKEKVDKWISKGLNVGFRIPPEVVVIDVDPRNGGDKKIRKRIAELMGYPSWSKLVADNYSVRTGGGGYHVYLSFPEGEYYKDYSETIEAYPGIELKRKGRQVLAPPSKHPSGNHYEFITEGDFKPISEELLDEYHRNINHNNGSLGGGEITGAVLGQVLEHLPIDEFSNHADWFKVMCASHHATGGDGVEEFIEWSNGDPQYSGDENDTRYRWTTLDAGITDGVGYATLMYMLREQGVDSGQFQASYEFEGMEDEPDEEEEIEWDVDDVEYDDDIDTDEIYQRALKLNSGSDTMEITEVVKDMMRMDPMAASRVEDALVGPDKAIRNQKTLTAVKKTLNRIHQKGLPERLCDLMFKNRYGNKRHIINSDGVFWIYRKTHWVSVHNNVVKRHTDSLVEKHRDKLIGNLDVNIKQLVIDTVDHMAIRSAVINNKVVTDERKLKIINCGNGEVWLNNDGSHHFSEHRYKSYMLGVLDVNYVAGAQCPLWLQTLDEIFEDFADPDDMIRHMGEVLGYIIQPNKDIASWWLFKGPGGDGKSTILKILSGVLGNSMLYSNQSLLSAGGGQGDSHATANLVGKLCVVIEELEVSKSLNDAGLKMFSEKTKMTANPKGKAAFQFDFVGGLIMCSNTDPYIKDITQGMRRRANVIPFNREFVKEGDADISRAKDIMENPEEMSGVLNWLLEGLARLRERGEFKVPKVCEIATNDWIKSSSKVAMFIDERCTKTKKNEKLMMNLLWIEFEGWCMDEEIQYTMSKKHFGEELRRLGYVVKKSTNNKTFVFNLQLIT